MNELFVAVAEHVMKISTDAEWIADYFNSGFQVLGADTQVKAEPDLHLLLRDGYGESFVHFEVDTIHCGDEIMYLRTDYRVRADLNRGRAEIQVHDEFALKHALINLYSTFIVHRQWGILIHSSCIVDKDQAYLFAGASGAGKSTVVSLSLPRMVLSDEATIVKISGDSSPVVYDSPFRSDLDSFRYGERRSLAAIQLLRQSQSIHRRPLGKVDGLIQLLDKVFYWAYEPSETAKVFGLCEALVRRVPVFELSFQKNDRFWKEIS